ncbi:serine/threonine-protein kinase [Streptomyces sp. ISL-100]|uniref:serine/threonine-protein kinase n=1 Tax=Streptomyces sp. ISL-100 TaxID=2819173 RepID=UPI001BE75218|nr:serine/threonine-protein kinase [Streptomyces sp. ISL-100]MBT2400042.1 serine/threonine protein kinase [Streptomyces sp. ISL-100]
MSVVGAGGRVLPARPGDPARIGPYRIVGRLGSGGMGTVHAALAPDGVRVAVKVIHPAQAEDPEFRARFRREVELSRRVTGPCLVPLLAADPDAAAPWLATAYVPGPTLTEHLAAHGPLAGGSLHAFATGTASALAAIHAADVVHRDVKPQNVILSPAGPRVLDFGIAHALDGTSVTRTGVMTGTPGWISPEHYRNGTAGPEGDVFAWGALVAYAATGRLPFGTGAPDVVAFRVMSEPAQLDGVPEGLLEIVEGALAKAPDERPPAAEAAEECAGLLAAQTTQVVNAGTEPTMVGELVAVQWDMPTLDDPAWHVPPVRSRRRTVAMVLAAAAVVGALAGGAMALVPEDDTSGARAGAPGTATPAIPSSSPGAEQPSAHTADAKKDDGGKGDGRASADAWRQARPAQGRGEHDVARAVLHDIGVTQVEGMEISPQTVTFHEPRKEVYLSYRLTGDEAGRLYAETEIAAAMCLTLQDVIPRLHPDLPYRKYVMVNGTPGRDPLVTWEDDFLTNTRCLSAADADAASDAAPDEEAAGQDWQPTDAGLAEAGVPSTDRTEIQVADRTARKIIEATNGMRQTLGTDRTLGHEDISVGFDPDGSAMYVWSNYVMWNQEQVETWGNMAAGETCRALVRQRRAGGSTWPYVHYAVAQTGASGYQILHSGTATTETECPT